MKQMKKRALALSLVATMLLSTTAFAADFGLPPDGELGMDIMGPMQQEDGLEVEEALAMMAELHAAVGYEATVGGYPIVDGGQETYFDNDSVLYTEDPIVLNLKLVADGTLEEGHGLSSYGSMDDVIGTQWEYQDAGYIGNDFDYAVLDYSDVIADDSNDYSDYSDYLVYDNVTGLMWQQNPGTRTNWNDAVERLAQWNEDEMYGYSDWRIPTVSELFSLVYNEGRTGLADTEAIPYISADIFEFWYGSDDGQARYIDVQMISSTIYDSGTLGDPGTSFFGYNFADGRIKAYGTNSSTYLCFFVRGNTAYGVNLFADGEDLGYAEDTVIDQATGLMWSELDSGAIEGYEEWICDVRVEAGNTLTNSDYCCETCAAMEGYVHHAYQTEADGGDYIYSSNRAGTYDWEDALAWVAEMNEAEYLGYSDWRMPSIKELQSLVDYTTDLYVKDDQGNYVLNDDGSYLRVAEEDKGNPAIDETYFQITPITSYYYGDDYAFFWSGTTHDDPVVIDHPYGAASYVVFGEATGFMNDTAVDAHGSGPQRSDPKDEEVDDLGIYPSPDLNAPQGDELRVYNMVRLVRDWDDYEINVPTLEELEGDVTGIAVEDTDYYEAVNWANDQRLGNGITVASFDVYGDCTRAEAITYLWKEAGNPVSTIANPFSDVSESDDYYQAVLWAVENGITLGTSESTFSPEAGCTATQITTFLYRITGTTEVVSGDTGITKGEVITAIYQVLGE